jgi:PAS domain S-box-containing protein
MSHINVLHIDDDPEFADLTATFLEQENDQLDVETTTDVDEALDRLLETTFDCIVSDYDMPRQNGLELLKSICQRFPDHPAPFILFTGKGSEDIAAEAMNSGATSYVQKGSPKETFEYLAERIKHDVRTARAERDQDRFATLVSALEDPVYVVNETGEFTFVNQAFIELVGYDRETIIGNDPSLVKSSDATETAEDQLGTLLSDSGPDAVTFEVDIQPKDDDPIPCEDNMGVLPYEGEEFSGSIGVLRDVTERKRREQQLIEAKSRYELLVDQNLVGLYIARDGTLAYHNDRFAEIFDYPAAKDSLVGKTLPELVVREDRTRLSENLQKVQQKNPESIRRPYVGRTAGGGELDIILLARGIEIDGEPAVLGTVLDVGKSEEEFWELRRERDRLDEFTSIVSHDLRGPLNIAKGHLELLASDSELEPTDLKTLEKATDAIDRAEELLEDVLSLAQEGKVVENKEMVGLRELAESTWEYVETESAELEVSVSGTIRADPSRLQGLFENLYRNAIKHGGPAVRVRVGELDTGFCISDTGPGIPDGKREEIFDTGYSTSETGTGFGLQIVKQVAEAHGWEINVTASAEGGARFEFIDVDSTA